jgi:hypothetical protein
MNNLRIRQALESALGYYDYTKDVNGKWLRKESPECPGYYFVNGEQFRPAFHVFNGVWLPSSFKPQGLETLWIESPKVRYIDLPGDIRERWQTWDLFVFQHGQDGKTIDCAKAAMASHFGELVAASSCIKGGQILEDTHKFTITFKDWGSTKGIVMWSSDTQPNFEDSSEESYFEQ